MGAATRLFVLRHGQTAWNAQARIQGQLDVPLDDTGRWQAARLAQALAGEELAAIYSSDLRRAQATAEALAAVSGLPVKLETALRERGFGRFEGATFAEIAQRWPDDAARWRRREFDFAPGGGETLRDFAARCVPAVALLAQRHRGELIAVVAHGGVLDCLYRAAAGIDLAAARTWEVGNARVNRLLHTDGGFTLVGWNDAQHLDAEALPG